MTSLCYLQEQDWTLSLQSTIRLCGTPQLPPDKCFYGEPFFTSKSVSYFISKSKMRERPGHSCPPARTNELSVFCILPLVPVGLLFPLKSNYAILLVSLIETQRQNINFLNQNQ